MFYLLKYFIKRLPREGFKSLSVPALAFALVLLICVLSGIKARMEEQFEYAMDELQIHIEVSDCDGTYTDGLSIGERYISQFTDPESLWTLYDYVEDVLLRTQLFILDEDRPGVQVVLWGVGWHKDISYIASDYNAGAEWHGDNRGSPDEITDIYPDPDVSIEIFEGFSQNLYEFYSMAPDDEGNYEYDGSMRPAMLVSEDLVEFIEYGYIPFSLFESRGTFTRVFPFWFQVAGIVKGPVSNTIFCNTAIAWTLRQYIFHNSNTTYSNTWTYLLPDDKKINLSNMVEAHITPYVPVIGRLVGISAPEADDDLSNEGDAVITFYDGYDASVFRSSEYVAVVSEDFLEFADDGMLKIRIPTAGSMQNKPGEDAMEVFLKIVGLVSGLDDNVVYAPFGIVNEIGMEASGRVPYTEILRATIADNRDLVEFKQTAYRTFNDIGVFFNDLTFAMTIYDAEFYNTTEALMQTIFFIDIATPFVYVITICVGFVASFLLTRRRKGEFAIMRSVGVNKVSVFFGTLFEQTLLCAIGVVLGCLVFTLSWGYTYYRQPLVFLACYMLGVIISAARAAGTDVLLLLRDKE